MNLPRSLVICGRKWRVVVKRLVHRGLEGQCVFRTREIQVCSTLTRDERLEVFLHELMHACWGGEYADKGEERRIRRLSPRLILALQGIGWAPGP